MLLNLILYVAVVVIASGSEDGAWKVVTISQGPVKGYCDPDGALYAFYGIPYATAPQGVDKFKAPLPPPSWKEPFEAVNQNILCPQIETQFVSSITPFKPQEDCLILNVYVPDSAKANLPVIVYIHGGAFQIGYGNRLTPKYLAASEEVVVVTFNYRLGVHGFLCLGTPDVPGNAGMKDQVAALRWVKNNIANFGGNPDDITIAGYSAGASSVELLLISDAAKDLFNKIIIESGSNLMGGAVVYDPIENAKSYAQTDKDSIINIDDIHSLEEYYKNLPFDKLFRGPFMSKTDSTIEFAPCVERIIDGNEFLTDSPINIMRKGLYPKIPMLFGFDNMEGLFRLLEFGAWKEKMNERFSDFLPGTLFFENEEQKKAVAKEVKKFYFGEGAITNDKILNYIDYFSDVIFIYPILKSVKLHAELRHEEIYLYEFTFTDEGAPAIPFTENKRGATHCAQTAIVLDGKNRDERSENDISEELKTMKRHLRSMWGNFAKTGTPVPPDSDLPEWRPAGMNLAPYMELTLPPVLRHEELLADRVHFWDELYEHFYRPPMPPPAPLNKHNEL